MIELDKTETAIILDIARRAGKDRDGDILHIFVKEDRHYAVVTDPTGPEKTKTVIKMKPMCNCGYIFKDLTIKHGSPMRQEYGIQPQTCPGCGKTIDCITYPTPVNGKFSYHEEDFKHI